MQLVLLDSVTDVTADDRGKVGICGSHGGHYAAAVASYKGLRAIVLNDAGRGMDDAGVAGLHELDRVSMAGVAVASESAEIGSAQDTLDNGIISFVNQTALALGVQTGRKIATELEHLSKAKQPSQTLEPAQEARWEEEINGIKILCVDSAALITPEDTNLIIITGSHGGLIGGDANRACKAKAKLVAYNDAGGGKGGIGFTRLPALQDRNIAGVTLDCMSCRIGDAASALQSGIISATNLQAVKLGFAIGQTLHDAISAIKH